MTPHRPYTFFNRPAAKTLYQALTPDPFYRTLEQQSSTDPETAREAMFRYMDYSMAEAREYGRLTLTPDGASGAAIWSLPLTVEAGKEISARKKTFILTHLGPASLAAYTDIVGFMSGQTENVVPDKAWYLSILGIRPNCQGRGMGKGLMAPVLREADALGRAVYAESFTPENFGFYKRLGFHMAKTVNEPVTGSSYTILVRPAVNQPSDSKGRNL